jgi:hypothetical protein
LNPGALTGEQVRQFRGEVRERLAEAQALRQELSRTGLDVSRLDEVIRDLRRLDGDGPWRDARELQRLQSALVDGVKQFEFGLRRDILGQGRDGMYLSGREDVPEGFRRMVEEYYRALARERRQ